MCEANLTGQALDPRTRAKFLRIALVLLCLQIGFGLLALWADLPILDIGLLVCGPVGYCLCRWRWLAPR